MLAVDTNVIVRFVTADDAVQFARSRSLFEQKEILLLKTVLLETEWVLRRVYGFDTDRTLRVFENLVGLPRVKCEDPAAIADAIRWTRGGMDFADALHLAGARGAEALATFDRDLLTLARRLTDVATVPA